MLCGAEIKAIKVAKQKKTKQTKLIDKYLILCNITKDTYDIDKYLDNLDNAYSINNFYPVLIYPKHITLLDYTKTHIMSFQKLLQPISGKHGFTF